MNSPELENFRQTLKTGHCSLMQRLLPDDLQSACASANQSLDLALNILEQLSRSEPCLLSSDSALLRLMGKQIALKSLSTETLASCLFTDQLFAHMARDDLLDKHTSAGLWQLKALFAAEALRNGLGDANRLLPLFDTLAAMLMGWWSDNTQLDCSQRHIFLLDISRRLRALSFENDEGLTQLTREVENQWLKEQEKNTKLVQRVIDAEIGRMKLHSCEIQIADLLNANCQQNTLAPAFIDYLQGPWHNLLLRILLHKGESPQYEIFWKRAAQLTRQLILSIQPGAHLKDSFSKYEKVPDELFALLSDLHCSEAEKTQASQLYLRCQQDLFKNNTEHYCAAPLIEKGRFFNDNTLQVSAHLKNKIVHLTVGDWFFYKKTNESRQLLQLVHNDTSSGQLLFVGVDPRLRELRSAEDVAFQLSSGLLIRIERQGFFSRHFENCTQTLWQRISQQQARLALKKAEETQQQQAQQRETQQRALEEKILLVRSLRQQYQVESKALEELRKQTKTMVTMLNLGAWISIRQADNTELRARLAVHITSSNKLIFVNREGLRIAEYTSQELIDKILSNEVEIINQGEDFNRTLSHVIGRLT
ncbi:MAG TPA: DUF1631 family protein [Pseudomonadales bacterium]|nr:DUF1631 family protein [Pseudomonadales bacterium]